MHCQRFDLRVHITRHARERMAERNILESELHDLLETGATCYKDDARLWIAKEMPGRKDNLVCAAVILEDKLVVKTVMHHFQWED
ncbi:DUF4258 domain-containing protein [Halomonas urmiana]|uniref:DUF4258 domain-containing protein n=1 Tax=Halomonas urmiana TaxID=490901 RepID=A0A5R8MCY1_9GAMM|nr:DUF4258 domain-containing protein [Halomonas urmiana]TLF47422.1 DUF4258 domain-containing protein [Halomonas urmiana]